MSESEVYNLDCLQKYIEKLEAENKLLKEAIMCHNPSPTCNCGFCESVKELRKKGITL